MSWYVYILECKWGTYYTGITNDLAKRLKAHNNGKGAKYTAQRRPVKYVWHEAQPNKSQAMKREIQIKHWRRDKKQELIEKFKKDFEQTD